MATYLVTYKNVDGDVVDEEVEAPSPDGVRDALEAKIEESFGILHIENVDGSPLDDGNPNV